MDFEPGLSLKGGARTVVPHSDPGSDADEEDEDEDVPTVLYTKEMTQQMLGDLSPQSVPVIKPASAPPETKSEFPILAVAPWLAIAAGILMVLYTLYHFM